MTKNIWVMSFSHRAQLDKNNDFTALMAGSRSPPGGQ